MLTVLGGFAEFERELILVRAGAGRDRAKAASRTGAAQAELARSYGVSQSTISRPKPRCQENASTRLGNS
jgi:hypothetical protein